MVPVGNLRKENFRIAVAAFLAIASLVGVSVVMFLDTHNSRWSRLESLEEIEALRREMALTEARVQEMAARTEQLETTHRQMTASFLEHLGVGPLVEEETPSALKEIEAFAATAAPNPAAPEIQNLNQYMDTLGDYINEVYRSMLKRQEYAHAVPTLTPTSGWVSSQFGTRNSPFTGSQSSHNGIDIAAPTGTPIYAAADGVVGFAGKFGGYGKYVLINHGFGIVTRYGHVSKYFVYPGQFVTRGQKIALVGSTGRSTGSHLHYEVRVANHAVDPRPFMLDASEKLLGDLWDLGEGKPRAPLPDFAPMGGDPEEVEPEPSPLIKGPKTRPVPDASATIKASLPAPVVADPAPPLSPLLKQEPVNITIEAFKLFLPWLVVGVALATLCWVSWKIALRLQN